MSMVRSRRGAWGLVLVPALAAGCSVGEEGSAGGDGVLRVEATVDPDNSLVAHVTVTADQPTQVVLSFESDDTGPRRMESTEAASSHEFTVVGLRAETRYDVEADATADDGPSASDTVSVTTGGLPDNAPSAEVIRAAEDPSRPDAGITLFGLMAEQVGDGPAYYGVDDDGHVVWYLDRETATPRGPVIRDAGDGSILAFFHDTIEHVGLDGSVVDVFDMTAAPSWHHDAVPMPGGGYLTLGSETRTVDGEEVRGDTIIELDSSGAVVWEWSSFDHLDTSRYPGELATAPARSGGTDWTHSNSVSYDEGADEILMSIRSQGWVVNIDHATGEVVWIAGEEDGTSPGFDAPFLDLQEGSWMSGQHAATLTRDGELLAYDNRNETGGEQDGSRLVAYELDDDAGTARQTVEFVASKYTNSLGDVDELDSGHFLVTSGGPAGEEGVDDTAYIAETDADGRPVWEIALADTRIYQAERVSWRALGQETR
jgi:hypothetical protein